MIAYQGKMEPLKPTFVARRGKTHGVEEEDRRRCPRTCCAGAPGRFNAAATVFVIRIVR